jgi:hypothetical protein
MDFILEYKNFYKPGDIVKIQYWYKIILPNGLPLITPVKILEKKGNKFLVSHNISQSKIQNAPDEMIKTSQIISTYRD